MIPVRQRYHSDESRLEFGDCLRCAVASILELSADDVPHFRHALSDNDPLAGSKMIGALVDWLRPRGIGLLRFNVKAATEADALTWTRSYNPESFLIVGGIGRGGQGHCVVAHKGEVAHDPGDGDDDGNPSLVGPLPDGEFVVLAFEYRPAVRETAPAEAVEIPPPPDCSILDKHERIGLSFSGGKDSLAVAFLLREHWPRMTFYNVDTGDLLPETSEIIDYMEDLVTNGGGGRFCRITTNSIAYQEKFGLVSDIVTHDCTPTGQALLHGKAGRIPLIDRATCCSKNIALPVWSRMQADGITLTIRGVRRADPSWGWLENSRTATGPTTFQQDALTIWAPIADWTTAQVFAYLRSVGAPIARYYEGPFKHSGPECARCTAWLDEGRGAYLKKYHPALAGEYFLRLQRVRSAIRPTLAQLESELDALSL